MPDNVFLACFLACLLAFAIVAIFAWQLGGWFVSRAFRAMGITRQTMTFDGGARISTDTDPESAVQVDHASFPSVSPAEIAEAMAKSKAEHDAHYAEFLDEARAIVLIGAHLAQNALTPKTLSDSESVAWSTLITNARIALEHEARTKIEEQRAGRGAVKEGRHRE